AGGRRQEAEGQGGKGAEGNEERRVSSSSASSPSSSSSSAIWEALGGVLLLLGWLVTVRTQPGQAIVISGLGLQFFYRRLERYSLNSDFTVIFLTGLQAIWLGWRLVPGAFQELAVITATAWTNSQNEPWTLLGVALFPYIALMLTFTGWLYRREKRELASFGEQLTLILGVILTIIALNNPILRSLNLFLSSVSLLVVCKRRASSPDALVYLTHITGLVTVCSFINWFFPDLPREVWASILLVLMVGEWLFSLGQGIWQRSAWYIGVGLASLSFIPLWVNTETYWTLSNIAQQNSWCAVWLITPVTLTFLVSRTSERQRQDNLILSLVTVIVAQLLTLPLPTTRVIGLAVGLIVMFINTYYLQIEANAGFTVGFGLSLIAAILWQFFPNLTVAGWLIVCAVATFSLWIGKKILLQREQELTNLYAGVSDKWAIALCGVELLGMTLHSAQVYQGYAPAGIFYIVATTITLSAIIYRTWGRASDIAFYGVGWCLELLTAEILGFGESSIIKVAIANIGLGLTTQLFGEWWRKRFQVNNLPDSLHILPLIYGAFSLLFRINDFTSWTGLCSLGVALIFVGVGRRRTEFKPLVYLGIIGISLSAYELLFYQMSQARGGVIGDGLIAMSALGAGIMFAYRRLTPILVNYFNLTRAELKAIAHFHWGVSSLLFIAALTAPVQINLWLGFGTGLFLARYAIFEGRRQTNDDTPATTNWGITHNEIWVYLGLIEAVMLAIYLEKLPSVDRVFQQIIPWESAIASIIAYFLYILPWQKWRWSKTPWQNVAYILPLISVWQTQTEIYPITLIFTAVYYAFLAKFAANLRFTYISLGLIDWALFRWLDSLRLTDSIWYVTIIGLSLLYIAQIDPQLQQYQSKEPRHVLRMTASGAICGWAVLYYQNLPLIPGIFSLITIFAGLGLKVRAYLYVGSAAFFATSIYQMVIFSLNYSFLKWIIGLLVGILLIYIAANFETRRAQINTLLRNISEELTNWQ
ncbi:MAG TPA: DUF2157 domain-containing protein, partial [Nostocaceae cyanobacterium]|nr:DUF2157 domain-containing protein [Nostocaceae cyanobacterium]